MEIEFPLSVNEMREQLKKKVAAMEEIIPRAVALVNTPTRRELMQAKVRELLDSIEPGNLDIQKKFDTFCHLAMDWVYSDRLEWDGSIADVYAKKMMVPRGQ